MKRTQLSIYAHPQVNKESSKRQNSQKEKERKKEERKKEKKKYKKKHHISNFGRKNFWEKTGKTLIKFFFSLNDFLVLSY